MAASTIIPQVQVSEVFCCGQCHDNVALTTLPGGDLAYECINPRCRKTVHVDCPEALALIDDVVIELAAPRVLCEVAQ